MNLHLLFVVCVCVFCSQTYDDASHPADITLEWVECESSSCDYDMPAPSPIPITCATGGSLQHTLVSRVERSIL